MPDFGGPPRNRESAEIPYFKPPADDGGHRRILTGWASGAVGRGFKSLRARQISLGFRTHCAGQDRVTAANPHFIFRGEAGTDPRPLLASTTCWTLAYSLRPVSAGGTQHSEADAAITIHFLAFPRSLVTDSRKVTQVSAMRRTQGYGGSAAAPGASRRPSSRAG